MACPLILKPEFNSGMEYEGRICVECGEPAHFDGRICCKCKLKQIKIWRIPMNTTEVLEKAQVLLFETEAVVRAKAAELFPGSTVKVSGPNVSILLADGRALKIESGDCNA